MYTNVSNVGIQQKNAIKAKPTRHKFYIQVRKSEFAFWSYCLSD